MDGQQIGLVSKAFQPLFVYEEAFSRNLGWLSEWEQQALRFKRVAIAGLGGVGGSHLLTLTRFGIGAFHIADPDSFELVNFNRQAGATIDSIGRSKADVLTESALKINPELRIKTFRQGVTLENVDEFLNGVDLFIDALDFFALDIRRKVSARCLQRGIPIVNAAPLGMGVAFLIFQPGGMNFEEWFQLDGLKEEHQYVNYLLGMAPAGLQRPYLVDPSRVDLIGRRGPSTSAACELCAGIAATEGVKLLLGRESLKPVPYYHHFDAYRGRWVSRKLRSGNRSVAQRVKIGLSRPLAAKLSAQSHSRDPEIPPASEIEKILNIARWAPSGDNIQPWRFQAVTEERIFIYLKEQSAADLYDYRDGEPTLLSGGALLESIRIAASAWGRRLEWKYAGRDGAVHKLAVDLPKTPAIIADPLLAYVPLRSVDRRQYQLRSLGAAEKQALEHSLGDACRVTWHEGIAARWHFARLGAMATLVRLSTPEAFPIHQRVIDWSRSLSPTGIPATAAGLSPLSRLAMKWALGDWERMRTLMHLGGGLAGAVEMDYLPGLCSSAFFTIGLNRISNVTQGCAATLIEAGQSIQRFWLTATSLGLVLQPSMATLIFAHYGERPQLLTTDDLAQRRAAALTAATEEYLGGNRRNLVFMGRIGWPRSFKQYRSVRRSVQELLVGREER